METRGMWNVPSSKVLWIIQISFEHRLQEIVSSFFKKLKGITVSGSNNI